MSAIVSSSMNKLVECTLNKGIEQHTPNLLNSKNVDCFVPRKCLKEALKPGTLIDMHSDDLLPGFVRRPNFEEQLTANRLGVDDFVLCHMTDFLSANSKIMTNLESGHYMRPTTHFSLNHAVGENNTGSSWKSKKYAILLPMKEAVKLNGKPAGCLEVDTYWAKSLNYNSKQGIVLVHDATVPQGKLKVLEPSNLQYHPESRFLVLASSEKPHDVVNQVILKMGRTSLSPGSITWGVEDISKFNTQACHQRRTFKNFLQKNGFSENMHDASSHSAYEKILGYIDMNASFLGDSWCLKQHDYKAELLGKLDILRKDIHLAEQSRLKLDAITHYIQNSEKPSEAVPLIQNKLNITSLLPLENKKNVEQALQQVLTDSERLKLKEALVENSNLLFNINLSSDVKAQIQQNKVDILGSVPVNQSGLNSFHQKTDEFTDRIYDRLSQATLECYQSLQQKNAQQLESITQKLNSKNITFKEWRALRRRENEDYNKAVNERIALLKQQAEQEKLSLKSFPDIAMPYPRGNMFANAISDGLPLPELYRNVLKGKTAELAHS